MRNPAAEAILYSALWRAGVTRACQSEPTLSRRSDPNAAADINDRAIPIRWEPPDE